MTAISLEEMTSLAAVSDGACVSIYMPTLWKSSEVQQNPIRFKNLIRQAEVLLVEGGLEHQEASRLLQPAMDLDEEDFWQHQDHGLAIFVSGSTFRYYRLPIELPELVVVTDRFHLKPLLQLLTGDGQFYVLALSQHKIRLFEGDRFSIQEIDTSDIPQGMEEILQLDKLDKTWRDARVPNSGAGSSRQDMGMFFRHGGGEEKNVNNDIRQYFYRINDAVREKLTNAKAPLVLAGVDYLLPLYREANSHPILAEQGITGSGEDMTVDQLHQQVWEIVHSHFAQERERAIAHYHELSDTDKITTDLNEIVPAAYFHRVDTLFVPVGIQQWGLFDEGSSRVDLHEEQEPGDEDLLDFAAVHTLKNGGKVYAVQPGEVPDDAPLAAVFRY
jgi:hypothetical protein